jgi:zinc protease
MNIVQHFTSTAVAAVVCAIAILPAKAEVTVVEAAGVDAWLEADSTVPVAAISFRIEGGAAFDPPALQGRARLAASLLTEGAGPYDAAAFKKKLADLSASIEIQATQDAVVGNLYALTDTIDEAAKLLGLALTQPRFDPNPLERARASYISSLARGRSDPSRKAYRAWLETAFANHPYARSTRGRKSSLAIIQREDLMAFTKQRFGRDRLIIAAAGDLSVELLQQVMVSAFGDLPATAEGGPADLPAVSLPEQPLRLLAAMPSPQSTIVFGGPGIRRVDPDWRAATVLMQIMGGGFGARLMQEVREKRGLVYGISANLNELAAVPLVIGTTATANSTVAETVAVVEAEWARMGADGPTAEELADAKAYLTGSLPLALNSTNAIADVLLAMRRFDLPKDYLEQRASQIEAVTMEDVKRVSKRLFNTERFMVAVAGAPEKLEGWKPTTVTDDKE